LYQFSPKQFLKSLDMEFCYSWHKGIKLKLISQDYHLQIGFISLLK